MKRHEENISIIKEQYKQIQKIYVAKIEELEDKLISITNKLKSLEKQKSIQNDGYINEINLMRNKIKSFEEYVEKLLRLTHGLTDKTNKIHQKLKSEKDRFISELNQFYVNYKYLTFNIKFFNIYRVIWMLLTIS